MAYMMFRFTSKFGFGAVVALIHDVIVTVGAFSVFQWTFDLPTLAAVLAVIGYSVNDTSSWPTGSARTSASCAKAPRSRSSTCR